MLKSTLIAAALIAAAAAGHAAAPLAFDVASIKPAAPCCAPGQWRESKAIDDRIDFRYVTMRYCIAFAWRMKEHQVSGPAWIGELRFDIVAKGPAGTRREQLPEMMQTLLAERFKLAVHQEKKDFNVYALLVGKNGPKLKESPAAEPGTPEGANFGMSMSGTGVGKLEAKRADMTSLANTLPRLVGRPVVNLTGLEGRYDFDVEFSREDVNGMVMPAPGGSAPPAPEFGSSIFSAIQRVGLRLEAQKLPLDTIVVDRAEKTATEN